MRWTAYARACTNLARAARLLSTAKTDCQTARTYTTSELCSTAHADPGFSLPLTCRLHPRACIGVGGVRDGGPGAAIPACHHPLLAADNSSRRRIREIAILGRAMCEGCARRKRGDS